MIDREPRYSLGIRFQDVADAVDGSGSAARATEAGG
jgi:hypothetical protein